MYSGFSVCRKEEAADSIVDTVMFTFPSKPVRQMYVSPTYKTTQATLFQGIKVAVSCCRRIMSCYNCKWVNTDVNWEQTITGFTGKWINLFSKKRTHQTGWHDIIGLILLRHAWVKPAIPGNCLIRGLSRGGTHLSITISGVVSWRALARSNVIIIPSVRPHGVCATWNHDDSW